MIMSNAKITYIQATEDCYSRMSDAKFVKEFEKIHAKDISENYTVMQAKFLPPMQNSLLKKKTMLSKALWVWKTATLC